MISPADSGASGREHEEVRRAPHVFISFSDDDALARRAASPDVGTDGVAAPAPSLVAASVLTGEEYKIDAKELGVLASLPVDRWLKRADVVAKTGVAPGVLDEMAVKGLIVTTSTALEATSLRERAELIAGIGWNKHALLYHYFSRWHDESVPDDAVYETIELLSRFRDFTRRYGSKHAHFHESKASETRALPLVRPRRRLYSLLEARKTSRSFEMKRPTTLEQLATTLYYTWGCHGYAKLFHNAVALKKVAPSGGALHPTEVYPIIRDVEGVTPGLYHYSVEHHRLDLVTQFTPGEASEMIDQSAAGQSYFSNAQAVFLMTTRFARSYWKYRYNPLTYRVLMMDVGHLSQTFYLVCTDLGLAPFVTGTINHRNIEEMLGLDGDEEAAIAMCGFGWPAEEPSPFEPFTPRSTVIDPASGGLE